MRFVYIWSTSIYGVGWGGDINVVTTTSLIVRPDDYVLHTTLSTYICSLEDATCYYVDTTLGWGGVGWGGEINVLTTTFLIVRPDDYVLNTTLSTYRFS